MAKYDNLPVGWGYEGPDESVGIFGEEWVHEDCLVHAGPGYDEIKGVDKTEHQTSEVDFHGVAQFRNTLTCNDCGAQATFDTDEFMGVDEEAA